MSTQQPAPPVPSVKRQRAKAVATKGAFRIWPWLRGVKPLALVGRVIVRSLVRIAIRGAVTGLLFGIVWLLLAKFDLLAGPEASGAVHTSRSPG